MLLPHAQQAVIPRAKIENYLLDSSHPIGGGKARFFIRFGFSRERWQALADAFRRHPVRNQSSRLL